MSASAFANGKVDTGNKKELAEFNTFMEMKSYVTGKGFAPSYEDFVAFKCFSAPPNEKDCPHLARWYRHIKSFDENERSSWPKQTSAGQPESPSAAANGKQDSALGDDDFDLFGDDDSEDEEKKRVTEERLKAYAEKKAKKPGTIAKSNVIFDVKPWDDSIEINDIEKAVRSIALDGLLWGASKTVPIAFGINKLQIGCCIEDEKVSTDWMEEQITGFEDLVNLSTLSHSTSSRHRHKRRKEAQLC